MPVSWKKDSKFQSAPPPPVADCESLARSWPICPPPSQNRCLDLPVNCSLHPKTFCKEIIVSNTNYEQMSEI